MPQIDVSQAMFQLQSHMTGHAAGQGLRPPRTLDREEWPPDYGAVLAWRRQQLARFEQDPGLLDSAKAYYATDPVDWINHWADTFDPRNVGTGKLVQMPLVMFRRQEELVLFFVACMEGDGGGLVEKSRDMGATWIAVSFSIWLWLFHPGVAVGWGTNITDELDQLGDPNTIFEKMRNQVRLLPPCFRPAVQDGVHLKHRLLENPENGAVIRGQGGKNIGRGGRSRLYFVDEAAHLEFPEAAEAALSENTRCRIDISSVSGPGTVFHRKREAGLVWEPGQTVVRDRANVLVMDWTDHPEKNQEWYGQRRAYFENQGTPEVVAREIDRDYMAAVTGIIIKYEWAVAAIDAHVVLEQADPAADPMDAGLWSAGLDVADEGRDANALVKFKGLVAKYAEDWRGMDPGEAARRTLRICGQTRPITLNYDCIGIGSNVKSEINRLERRDNVDLSWLTAVPWNAGARVQEPHKRVLPDDPTSPTNRDQFANFKAQAWWNVGRRFYKTWRAVQAVSEGHPCPYDLGELISLDSASIPEEVLNRLLKELAQAAMTQDSRLRSLVDKAPQGATSPNLADALVMDRFPAKRIGGQRVGPVGVKVLT